MARFAPALPSFVAVSNGVQVAAAAGKRQEMMSSPGMVQRAYRALRSYATAGDDARHVWRYFVSANVR